MASTLKDLKDGKGPVVPPQTPPPKPPTPWDIYASRLIATTPAAQAAAPATGLQTGSNGVGVGFGANVNASKGDLWTRPAGYRDPANPNSVGGPGPGGSPLPEYNMSQILSGMPKPGAAAPKPRPGPGGGGTPVANVNGQPITLERIAQDRQLMSQNDWMTKYGNVNFDINAIKSIFDAATNAEYAAKDREYAATERKFYDQKGTEQQSLLDAKRRAAAQNAVQTGANRGMQNAMQLTDTIQQSAAAAPDALALAEGRRALIDQQQAALTLNAKEAEALAEQRKLDYAKVGSEIYATDAQKYVGELGYDAAALESAMTKYGIDRSHGGGAQQITQPTVSQASIIQQQGAYRQLYAKAQASGDTATAQMAASMLGLLAMQAGG